MSIHTSSVYSSQDISIQDHMAVYTADTKDRAKAICKAIWRKHRQTSQGNTVANQCTEVPYQEGCTEKMCTSGLQHRISDIPWNVRMSVKREGAEGSFFCPFYTHPHKTSGTRLHSNCHIKYQLVTRRMYTLRKKIQPQNSHFCTQCVIHNLNFMYTLTLQNISVEVQFPKPRPRCINNRMVKCSICNHLHHCHLKRKVMVPWWLVLSIVCIVMKRTCTFQSKPIGMDLPAYQQTEEQHSKTTGGQVQLLVLDFKFVSVAEKGSPCQTFNVL